MSVEHKGGDNPYRFYIVDPDSLASLELKANQLLGSKDWEDRASRATYLLIINLYNQDPDVTGLFLEEVEAAEGSEYRLCIFSSARQPGTLESRESRTIAGGFQDTLKEIGIGNISIKYLESKRSKEVFAESNKKVIIGVSVDFVRW